MKSTGAENRITLWQKKHWTENWCRKYFFWKRYFILYFFCNIVGQTANVGKIATISENRSADFYIINQFYIFCSLKGVSQYLHLQRFALVEVSQQTLDA